jgi:PDZ domain-containing secreted protein
MIIMLSKAVTKWTIEVFLCIVVIVAGMIIILLAMSSIFVPEICPRGQEDEILKVVDKVKEVSGRPGYEIVYFEVKKECVEYIKSSDDGRKLKVKYKTVENETTYPTDGEFDFEWKIETLTPSDTLYPLRVFADRVEVMR